MRLLLHQFRKDFIQTWIIWALWLFFVLVQFGLAAWTVNPGDLMAAGIYGQIIGMVPAIHAILLFVLIPLLVFQETPVGTTAFWLSRPMPPLTVLGSKLISFGILVLVPLVGQCVVLFSHHVVLHDVVMAGVEIALKELTWIALATGLAVLCPNFGAFLVAAAALYVLQYFSGWIWSWISLLHAGAPPMGLVPQAGPVVQTYFLGQSRLVASDLVCIVFGFGVVFLQYLTRRTRLAVIVAFAGLVAIGAVAQYWPWDFVNLLVKKPAAAPTQAVAVAPHFQPSGNHGTSERSDPRGGTSSRSLMVQFAATGLDPEENLTLLSEGGEQVFPDGSKLVLKPDTGSFANSMNPGFGPEIRFNRFGYNNGINMAAIDAAIGGLPILNQQFNASIYFDVQDLFTLDSGTFSKQGADLGTAEFHLKGALSGFRITAEIPLVKGAFFSNQSQRTTLTEILKTDDGVNIALNKRSLNLLLAPVNPVNSDAQPIYLLLNRKRGEALGVDGNFNAYNNYFDGSSPLTGLLSVFNVDDNHFEVFTPIRLAFHSEQVPSRPLPVPIDDVWIADATLVQLESSPHGHFDTTVKFSDFALDGHTLSDSNEGRAVGPDLDSLQKIVLPPNPTRTDVWRYITHILYLSAGQRNCNQDDPQVEMLARVGPQHATELLIASTVFNGFNYAHLALKSIDLRGQEDAKAMIFRLLLDHNDLIELVVGNHWEEEAKPILLSRLTKRQPGENIDDRWLDALALFHDDPTVKQAILDLLPSQQNVIRIVIANHWEADAKPILISVIARTKPGSPIDDRWIQVLDSFHDDSRVKAMLLRVLPSNQNAIETVVENHWENDAKPILLDALNKAKPGDTIDDRWFSVLASMPDQSGIKEAILRVLPFCHNAIETVVACHWESDAKPILLDTLNKAKPGTNIDDQWFWVLASLPNQSGVQEAVLRVLPFCRNGIETVIRSHWEAAACPVILDTLVKARAGEAFDDRWFQALNPVSDQKGVKDTILRVLPKLHNAIGTVIFNHWEADAKPIILDTFNKAKPGDYFDDRWYAALGTVPDQTGVKEAVLRILPFVQTAAGFVIQNHWEEEARPVVLAALASAKPNDNFNNQYIGIAAGAPQTPGVKEAILHILPRNEQAIDFITQNHWEADAEPILLRKMSVAVLGQDVNPKWVKALAFAHDPASYPLLLAYTEKKLNTNHDWSVVNNIRPLPGTLLTELVGRTWNSVRGTDAEPPALGPVASWGFPEALDRAAATLIEPRETDKQKLSAQDGRKNIARKAISGTTPCPDGLLDPDLAAWWTDHKAKLGFDPELGRFVLHPKPLTTDQGWPTSGDAMKELGRRAEGGDTAAFDELEATITRAIEGIDPKQGADKIKNIRDGLANGAFNVLRNDVAKNPGILAVLETANRQPDLRSYVVDVYGRAAQEGNQEALQAMLNYQAHQWNLPDVVGSLGGAVSKEDPRAIAFEGNLSRDPNCTAPILERASGELLGPANAGNESARAAYRTLRQARSQL